MVAALNQIEKVIQNIEQVVVGKRNEIELSLVAFFAGGHVLLEDVPGVGKTMMVKALARSFGAEFKRLQFTPDLLPSDVTGVSIYNQRSEQFEFRPGPIMANIVLADEINRTSPKTQSALLEALEEGSVTVDGETLFLEKPFMVMATQNPIEYAGTFPLPEAQLDRFLLKLNLGYPTEIEELEILNRLQNHQPLDSLEAVMSIEEVKNIQAEIISVVVSEEVKMYIIELVHETRKHRSIELGVSPRGTIALMKAAQVYAFLKGRAYVLPDDVKYLAPFVLSHRIMLTAETRMSNRTSEELIRSILEHVRVPVSQRRLTRS
ncbi:AAA family ATPase [Halalkalibacter akibai]|uniref:MoxR-like ATPases n=1 Tax=Halalkalibacter akibai (strain ATCC 43226 / DSM 21942 / CIP 109018 / JCM 9157 / 1139) TaxID=1236973 RepID=W4R1W6_HALA3|nr:MoxR family ATPase [Halalkalibacter akibai]GAE37529.1 MoxR-like ATPases [Halalkalibacter akibai JCM 9157]